MIKRKILILTTNILFGISIFSNTIRCANAAAAKGAVGQAGPTKPAANMPDVNITQDQMQKMDCLMEGMSQFYEKLPPAEKAQFEKELAAEIEAEQKKIASMDPAAQKKYMEDAFGAFDKISLDELIEQLGGDDDYDGKAASESTSSDSSDSEDKSKDVKASEKEKDENKKKIKALIDLISNIIKTLNKISEKFSGIQPSAQDLVDNWIQKGYIQKWAGAGSSWNTFSNDLSTMKQKIEKLKQTDPKTGKYYYLDNVKNVEKLSGQLEMLYSTIKKYEPSIELNAAGKMKNEAAKSALTSLINYLAETTKTISKSIDDVITKFGKEEAPKIKKQEEDTKKKAERVPRAYGRTTEAGTADRSKDDDMYSIGSDSTPTYYGPAFTSGGTSQSSGYSAWESPEVMLGSDRSSDSGFGGGSSGGSRGSSPAASQSESKPQDTQYSASSPYATSGTTAADLAAGQTKSGAAAQAPAAAQAATPQKSANEKIIGEYTGKLAKAEINYETLKKNKIWAGGAGTINEYLKQGSTTSAQDAQEFEAQVQSFSQRLGKANKAIDKSISMINDLKEAAVRAKFKKDMETEVAKFKTIASEINSKLGDTITRVSGGHLPVAADKTAIFETLKGLSGIVSEIASKPAKIK